MDSINKIIEKRIKAHQWDDKAIQKMSPQEINTVVHELLAHQAELEIENEELTQTKVELENAKNNHNDSYDCAPIGYYVLDPTGTIVEANRFAAQQLGVQGSSLPKTNFSNIVSRAHRRTFQEFLNRVFTSDVRQTDDIQLIRTISPLYAHLEGIQVKDIHGQPHCSLAVIDISQQKKAEERAQWLSTFTEHNPNPIVEVDPAGNITYMNETAKQVFPGLVRAEEKHPFIEGCLSFFSDQNSAAHKNCVKEINVDGRWFRKEFQYIENFNRLRIYGLDITERKKAEESFRKSEEQCRRIIIEITNEGIVLTDSNDKMNFVNNKMADMLGYSVDDLIGRTDLDFMPKDQIEDVHANRKKLTDKNKIEGEYCFLRKDGSLLWAIGNTAPFFDDNNNHIGNLSMFTDITDRKHSEEMAKSTLDRFYLVLSNMTFAILLVTGDGRVELVNQAFCDIFNLKESPSDLKTITSREIIDKIRFAYADPDQADARIVEIVNQRLPVHDEEVHMRGGRTYVRDFIPIPLSDNKFSRLWIQRDITERKRAEEALRNSEEQYRMLFETITEGFSINEIILDAQGKPYDFRFLRVNPAFERHTGLKASYIQGKTILELFPQTRQMWFEIYEKVILSGAPAHFEKRLGPLGRWFELNVFRTGPRTFVIVCTDITDKKKIDAVLQRDKETLEKLVNEKTESLLDSHRELERSKRMADIGRLSSTIAHELRNPLGVIGLAVHNIQRKSKNHLLDKHIETINKKILEGDQIIQNLLNFSRIKKLNIEKLDVCTLMRECIDTVTAKYANWHIELKQDLDCKEGDFIEADFTQFKILISNILDNAYQALHDKSGTITVIAKKQSNKMWKLSITDTGTGIDEQEKEKIFDPFYTTKSRGTGLGLAVCREIVEMHRGKIEVQSVKDKGTTFTVVLPSLNRNNNRKQT
ncbi:MAG: PAS domain S-box protein [Endomicrobiales bacterium]